MIVDIVCLIAIVAMGIVLMKKFSDKREEEIAFERFMEDAKKKCYK